MSLISQINEIKKKISGEILFDKSLSKYSWFNFGGPAKVIFKPKNLNELSIFVKTTLGFIISSKEMRYAVMLFPL